MARVRTQDTNGTKPLIDYIETSAGAADAGKFAILDATGKFDTSLVDLSSAGNSQSGLAGQPIALGDAITKIDQGGNDRIFKASAVDATKPCIGFATSAQPSNGQPVSWIPLVGDIALAAATAADTRYYLGTSAGSITTDVTAYVTGNVVQALGFSSSIGRLNMISEDVEVIA